MAQAIMNGEGGSRRGSLTGSRRGSLTIAGTERRGSFYGDEVSKRSSVAIVVDDPNNKKNMTQALNDIFEANKAADAILGK